jgi:hypothetical protein
MTKRNFFLLVFAHFEVQYLLTNKNFSNMNNIMAVLLCMYKIEHRMQICLRNPRIACSTDHVGNIPLRKLNLNVLVLIKAYPIIPISGRSKLVRRYLKTFHLAGFDCFPISQVRLGSG